MRTVALSTKGSSSITRMVKPASERGSVRCAGDCASGIGAGSAARGNSRVMVVPAPNLVERVMVPCMACTVPYTIDSPRPVPLPTGLVVKNGSKACSRTCSVHAQFRCPIR